MKFLAIILLLAQQGVSFTASVEHETKREDGTPKVSSYRIYTANGTNRIRVTEIGKPTPDSTNTISVSTTAPFTGFEPGTYDVFVAAFGPDGESPESNRDSFTVEGTTPPPPPDPTIPAPTGLHVWGGGETTDYLALGWTDNAINETGFGIERCTGAACTLFAQVGQRGVRDGTGFTDFVDRPIQSGTSYMYRVRAFNSTGVSPYSNLLTYTPEGAPPSPPPQNPACTGSVSYAGSTWSFGPNCETWRDGAHVSGGYGFRYKVVDGTLYVLGTDNNWYRLTTALTWEFYGSTEPMPAPPQEVCGDGIDNDNDGLVDEGCAPPPPPNSDTEAPVIRSMVVARHGKSQNNTVMVDVIDNNIETVEAEFFLDNVLISRDPIAPFSADMRISSGSHVVRVEVQDAAGNMAVLQQTVVR